MGLEKITPIKPNWIALGVQDNEMFLMFSGSGRKVRFDISYKRQKMVVGEQKLDIYHIRSYNCPKLS